MHYVSIQWTLYFAATCFLASLLFLASEQIVLSFFKDVTEFCFNHVACRWWITSKLVYFSLADRQKVQFQLYHCTAGLLMCRGAWDGVEEYDHLTPIFSVIWRSLPQQYKLGVTMRRCHQHKAPQYLIHCVTPASDITSRQRLRCASRHQLFLPRYQLS